MKSKLFLAGLLALPALVSTNAGLDAAEVRDTAGMFSPAAIREAEAVLDKAERLHKIPTVIETIDSLGAGVDSANPAEVRKAIDRLSLEKARKSGIKGVYVLIARDESEIEARDYKGLLGKDGRARIEKAFVDRFRQRKFDDGLIAGASTTSDMIAAASPARSSRPDAAAPLANRYVAGPDQPRGQGNSSGMAVLVVLGLVIVGILVISRVLGGRRAPMRPDGMPGQPYGPDTYGNPGYAGPGQRGGGGGFLPGLFGGLGGAIAGNWIYDQMTGRHHHPSTDPYGQAGNALPTDTGNLAHGEPATDDWGGGDGGMDWGDSGGGDWGGDAGGGDWG